MKNLNRNQMRAACGGVLSPAMADPIMIDLHIPVAIDVLIYELQSGVTTPESEHLVRALKKAIELHEWNTTPIH